MGVPTSLDHTFKLLESAVPLIWLQMTSAVSKNSLISC